MTYFVEKEDIQLIFDEFALGAQQIVLYLLCLGSLPSSLNDVLA